MANPDRVDVLFSFDPGCIEVGQPLAGSGIWLPNQQRGLQIEHAFAVVIWAVQNGGLADSNR